MPALDDPLIRQKLAELSQYLDELEPLTACEFKEYQADYVKRHAIEKLLELIVEIASDITRHLVEAAGEAPPQTYYSTFDEAGKLGVLPESLAARLATTTGLRNRLVHGYEKIEHAIVHRSLKPFLRNYKRYFVLINDYLDTHTLPRS
jgi:uncharacterized protein YutE (UPF0331/DUF86 family)